MRQYDRQRDKRESRTPMGWQKWFAILTAVIFLSLMFGGVVSLFIH